MDEVKIGLLGCGVVGGGVARILTEQADVLARRVGARVTLARVAERDVKKTRKLGFASDIVTTDAEAVVDDPDLPLIVELIGGTNAARTLVLRACERGKHVATANKALLALHGDEVFAAARDNNVDIGFEASVAGGIPIIHALREGLAGNRIRSVKGIINGTSNYILSRMTEEGSEFDAVLADAQANGFAEADPTFDIDGTDAAHKIAILTTLAFGANIRCEDIPKEGIAEITSLDVSFASELGYCIKLLAVAETGDDDGPIEVRVHPALVPAHHHLATVGGAMNAVYVEGEPVGETMFYGLGAGAGPAGSAVVADIVEIARRLVRHVAPRSVPPRAFLSETIQPRTVVPLSETERAFYLRFSVVDKPGSLAQIAGILGAQNISIAQVIQPGRKLGEAVPIVIMTHDAKEANLAAALSEIDGLDVIKSPSFRIRLEA